MTQDEMKQIAAIVIEDVIVQMPTVIGNLMKNHSMLNKLNHDFYSQNPEFQNHKDIVTSVIEQVECSDISLKYEDILKTSIPIIKDRLKTVSNLNMNKVEKPSIPTTITFDTEGNGLI